MMTGPLCTAENRGLPVLGLGLEELGLVVGDDVVRALVTGGPVGASLGEATSLWWLLSHEESSFTLGAT